MSIRFRLILIILFASLIPVIITIILANSVVLRMSANELVMMASVAAFLVLFVVSISALETSRISSSLLRMAKAIKLVTQGHEEAFQPSEDRNELGILSRSIFSMRLQLSEKVNDLEQSLVNLERETRRDDIRWGVAAQIGRELSSVQDVTSLLEEVLNLVSERYGYYHIGLFLLDDKNEFAILRVASSSGGKQLLAAEYRVKLGEPGIISHVAQFGEPLVVTDVSTSHLFVQVPELQDTHSEATLPLRIRDRVIGVLDVQSTSTSFPAEDLNALQIITNQLALAIDNTRLNNLSTGLADELEQTSGQQVSESWGRYLRRHTLSFVYHYNEADLVETTTPDVRSVTPREPVLDRELNQIRVPLSIRDQVIGYVILSRDPTGKQWDESDLLLVSEVLEQVGPALESARLLEETQARAAHEQALNVLTTEVRRSASMEAILQNTVRELGRVFKSSRTFVQLGFETPEESGE